MIQFDRIENDRMYLGFTEIELDEILTLLEKHQSDGEITNRIDVLSTIFRQAQQKGRENDSR
jgi:hypothetical protein